MENGGKPPLGQMLSGVKTSAIKQVHIKAEPFF